MRRRLTKSAVLAVTLLSLLGAQAAEEITAVPERSHIEVVFVLDTTGSMSGLINAAKEKVWAIANTLASTKPSPDIKMGLVGYRDRGDEYVTIVTDLTDDLDAVYEKLMDFKANGGGDTPESVNQALHEAVNQIKWNKDDKTYRVVFLVGDCPPHMDYEDDVKYPQTCKLAAESGIIINTVQCGSHQATIPIWNDIADRAEGRYFRVEQSGGAILASTPFDKELAELSKDLEGTRVYYGSREELAEAEVKEEVAAKIHAEASDGAKARRAVFLAVAPSGASFAGKKELVGDYAGERVQLGELKVEELPEEMQKMSAEEREKFLADQLVKRNELQAKIKAIAAKRQSHIEEQVRQSSLKGKQSLDFAIYECIKEQAAKKGITYEKGPAF